MGLKCYCCLHFFPCQFFQLLPLCFDCTFINAINAIVITIVIFLAQGSRWELRYIQSCHHSTLNLLLIHLLRTNEEKPFISWDIYMLLFFVLYGTATVRLYIPLFTFILHHERSGTYSRLYIPSFSTMSVLVHTLALPSFSITSVMVHALTLPLV